MAVEYVEDLIYQALRDNAGVAAIFGNRIFPMFEQEGVSSPYLTYALTSAPRVGEHFRSFGNQVPSFQIDAWSASSNPVTGYREVVAGSWAVLNALDNKSLTSGAVRALVVQYLDWRDLPSETEPRIRRRQSDYLVQIKG